MASFSSVADTVHPAQLGNAIFERIEAWYNPCRRHTALHMLSPVATNTAGTSSRRPDPFTPPPTERHDHHTTRLRESGSGSLVLAAA
jgi:hypothetical protein